MQNTNYHNLKDTKHNLNTESYYYKCDERRGAKTKGRYVILLE
jgi:hypothetical protein